MKQLQEVKQVLGVLRDIRKCEMCSYYLSLIQNHAKIGHAIDKDTAEKMPPQ